MDNPLRGQRESPGHVAGVSVEWRNTKCVDDLRWPLGKSIFRSARRITIIEFGKFLRRKVRTTERV